MPCPFPQRIIWLRSCAPWVRAWCCTLVAHEGPLVILFARNIWKETGGKKEGKCGKRTGRRSLRSVAECPSKSLILTSRERNGRQGILCERNGKENPSTLGSSLLRWNSLFFRSLFSLSSLDLYERPYIVHVDIWTSPSTSSGQASEQQGPHQFLKIVRRLHKLLFCQKHLWWMWMVNHQKFSGDEIKGAFCPALEFLILLPSPS